MKKLLRMMPHPERNSDFKDDLLNILLWSKKRLINTKINMLLNSEHISYKSTRRFCEICMFLANTLYRGQVKMQKSRDRRWILYNNTNRITQPSHSKTHLGCCYCRWYHKRYNMYKRKPIALLDFLRFGR